MNFELGKKYIVDVTEKGIIPREEFLEERYFDKEYDYLGFLTDEEKVVVINEVLDKIKAEIKEFSVVDESGKYRISKYLVDQIIDKYRGEQCQQ